MSGFTKGKWEYTRIDDETLLVCPADCFSGEVIARVFTEANAKLIAAAPELKLALAFENEALRATEVFLREHGLDADKALEIVEAVDELLNRIDGIQED